MRRKLAARAGSTSIAATLAGWVLVAADAPTGVIGAVWGIALAAAFVCLLALESR